jgi:hypothetical protein
MSIFYIFMINIVQYKLVCTRQYACMCVCVCVCVNLYFCMHNPLYAVCRMSYVVCRMPYAACPSPSLFFSTSFPLALFISISLYCNLSVPSLSSTLCHMSYVILYCACECYKQMLLSDWPVSPRPGRLVCTP